MSQLVGGHWPSGLDLAGLELDGVSVRMAREGDREAFVDITERVLGPHAYVTFDITPDALRAGVRGDFHAHLTVALVAAGRPVGFVVIEQQPDQVWIDLMVLDTEHLGRGLGTAILTWLQTWSRATDVPLALSVLELNPARGLYERVGFFVERVVSPRVYMCWRSAVP